MIPLKFLANRVIYSSAGATGFMTAALVIQSYYLPIYFQAVKHATPTLSGVYILPSVLSQLIFSSVGGPLGELVICIRGYFRVGERTTG